MHRLIINADDFGFSASSNRGIIAGHKQGVVTSTTLMVGMPAAAEAASLARQHPKLGVGLHFNLTCGRPCRPAKDIPSLVDANGQFYPLGKFLRRLYLGQIRKQ